jgi:hypothetical protein
MPESGYGPEILDDEAIQRQIDEEGSGYSYVVYRPDEGIIAAALAQLLSEGGIDEAAKPTIRLAVARQLHPLVLQRLFDECYHGERIAILREVLRLLDAAHDVLERDRLDHAAKLDRAARKAAKRRALERKLSVCPWPVGSVLSRRLPSGKRLLLHLYRIYQYGWEETGGTQEELPFFYVLDWASEALPPASAVEGLKPADDWSFSLYLPPAKSLGDLEARRRSLEAVLEPTGLTKPAIDKKEVSRVKWERLDEHLIYHYDSPPAG